MATTTFVPVNGIIQNISPVGSDCCNSMVSIRNNHGITNFMISPATYVAQETRLRIGMQVTAFYDPSLPVPAIFPPQYQAAFMTRHNQNETVFVGNFDRNLVSSDNTLRLNIGRSTQVVTSNGQPFHCNVGGRLLMVYYTNATFSIPAQTTPRKVIVVC